MKIKKYESSWNDYLGRITVLKHPIVLNLLDAPSIYSAPYRDDFKERVWEWKEINKLQEVSMAEPVVTEEASPILLNSKKFGCLRFCVDYGWPTTQGLQDRCPIPGMDKWIDSLGEV